MELLLIHLFISSKQVVVQWILVVWFSRALADVTRWQRV